MHRLIYTCALFLCLLPASGQNWQLMPLDEPVSFRASSGKNLGFEVVKQAKRGSDLVLYLSPSLSDLSELEDASFRTAKSSYSTLMGAVLVVKNNGDTWLKDSMEGDSLLVKTLATTGNKWDMDAKKKIKAELISMFSAKIRGEQDSVKLVQLSNGRQLILTKNNGLWGTPNLFPMDTTMVADYGRTNDRRLSFREVNNFEIGDIFHKRSSRGFALCHNNYIDTVVGKVVATDSLTVTYTVQRVKELVCERTGPNPTTERTVSRKTITRTLNFSDSLIFQNLPNTLFKQPDSMQTAQTDSLMSYFLYDSTSRFGVPYMEAGFEYSWNSHERYYLSGAGEYYYINAESEPDPYYLLPVYFKKKDVEWGERLTVGKRSEPIQNNVSVYPNPANDVLHVTGLPEGIKGRIIDVTGKVFEELRLENGRVSVEALPAGSYFLALNNGQRIFFSVL